MLRVRQTAMKRAFSGTFAPHVIVMLCLVSSGGVRLATSLVDKIKDASEGDKNRSANEKVPAKGRETPLNVDASAKPEKAHPMNDHRMAGIRKRMGQLSANFGQ
jgi:hypothetical protein